MRGPLFAVLACLLLAPAAAAAPRFPYKAYVTSEDVYVRSGPGDNYYPTDKLKVGQEVEIYRHDPGGWYAIRPPQGSFSWVAGRYLQFDREHLATVAEDRVAARVGSRFSDVRDVIQVRLHRGETVEVLDARQNGPSTTTSNNTWYKIAPPAGEFRWVSGRFVDANFSADGVSRKTAADGRPLARVPGETLTAARGDALGRPGALTAERFQADVNDIDVELSTMIIEEPTVWDFGELRQRSESLFNQAETAVERGRARVLLSKIARFEDIKSRYQSLSGMRQEMARSDRQATTLAKSPLPPADPDGRFDARAASTRLADAKPGAPQYAILDDQGLVRCYVSPATGVNLRSYVGRDVGITGIRGYMPEQHATHIMARHVSVVEGTITAGNGTTLR